MSPSREPSDFWDVARAKIDLPTEERDRPRAAWTEHQAASKDAEKARAAFLRELRRLERRYPPKPRSLARLG